VLYWTNLGTILPKKTQAAFISSVSEIWNTDFQVHHWPRSDTIHIVTVQIHNVQLLET